MGAKFPWPDDAECPRVRKHIWRRLGVPSGKEDTFFAEEVSFYGTGPEQKTPSDKTANQATTLHTLREAFLQTQQLGLSVRQFGHSGAVFFHHFGRGLLHIIGVGELAGKHGVLFVELGQFLI